MVVHSLLYPTLAYEASTLYVSDLSWGPNGEQTDSLAEADAWGHPGGP